jgi:hypothetical protein
MRRCIGDPRQFRSLAPMLVQNLRDTIGELLPSRAIHAPSSVSYLERICENNPQNSEKMQPPAN